MKKPKVALLTSFTDVSPAYSLCGIVLDQARMLRRGGYDYDILALRYFNQADAKKVRDEGLNLRTEIAKTTLHDYQPHEGPREDFEEQVRIHMEGDKSGGEDSGLGYFEILEPYDVIITHDLLFLSWYLPQNKAIRACIDKWPEKRWMHWVHSAPSVKPANTVYPSTLRYQGAPNSTYVYLNKTQTQDLANAMQITRDKIAVVYNPKDVRDVYHFTPQSCALIDEYRLLDHDVLQVYPFSTPRWTAKGVRQLIAIFGAWKQQGIKAKLVLVNAHCTNPQDIEQVKRMEEYGRARGMLPGKDLIFTYRFWEEKSKEADAALYKDWNYSVPGEVVRDLQTAANTFIFPSVSECCSLVLAEASIMGKFVAVNENFPAMREFVDETVLHYRLTQEDPDKNEGYYKALAREMWLDMSRNQVWANTTRARTKTFNRDWIAEYQFYPLLYKNFDRQKD